MKYLKSYKLFETPDNTDVKAWGKSLTYETSGAYAFGSGDNGEMYLSAENDSHAEIGKNINSDNYNLDIINKYDDAPYDRNLFKYPGRIWIHDSIISFWLYPDSIEELNKILIDLNNEFKILFNIDIDTNRFNIEVYIDKYDAKPCFSGSLVCKEKWKYRAKTIKPVNYSMFLKGEIPLVN